jgi:hypothetical protein
VKYPLTGQPGIRHSNSNCMKRLFFLSATLLLPSAALLAQRQTKDFELTMPETKISQSLYNSIGYIDSRFDTAHFGIVQLGAFNRKVQVVPEVPFAAQVQAVMAAMIDSTAKDGKLLLQLRQFNFAEITGAFSEKGYFYLRADLYAASGQQYQKLAAVDTVVLVKTLDVTKALLRNGSKAITDFIAASLLTAPPTAAAYSLEDIVKIDSIEKTTIPAYTASQHTDGVYYTYDEFKNQRPGKKEIAVELNQSKKISSLKTIDADGKKTKVKSKDVYSVVHNGQLFVATGYGYYPVDKSGNDFYFTGKAKVTANTGDVIAASFFFGVLGGLIASNADATFIMKIDHINGGFIRIREVKPASE